MKIRNAVVVLDLETTGIWIGKDRIIEIAMIRYAPDGSRAEYLKKINPIIPIPQTVIDLTGITNEDVKDAPLFKNIAHEVLDFIGGADLGGFNVERFDLPVLEKELSDAGCSLEWRSRKIYDAQRVYHLNEKRDLAAAYKFYCDQTLNNAHSALADAQATFEILQSQIKKYGDGSDDIQSLDRFSYKDSRDFYDDQRKFRWWNGKLYIMFGKYAQKYSLQEVVQKDRGYLEWILSANFSDEVKSLVENALNGKYPVYEGAEAEV